MPDFIEGKAKGVMRMKAGHVEHFTDYYLDYQDHGETALGLLLGVSSGYVDRAIQKGWEPDTEAQHQLLKKLADPVRGPKHILKHRHFLAQHEIRVSQP